MNHIKAICILFLMIAFLHFPSNAQYISWQNTIGGHQSDWMRCGQRTIDGGFILGGDSKSGISGDKTEHNHSNLDDIWIVKTDSLGVIEWQNTIGATGYEYLYSLQQTFDNGYILGAISYSDSSDDKSENSIGSGDFWLIKVDSTGSIEWENTIGGYLMDEMFDVQQTLDGGFILGGFSFSNSSPDKAENCLGNKDYWFIKTSATGIIQFQNTIGGTGEDHLDCVRQTYDGGFILGGFSNSAISSDKSENSQGLLDYWVVKLDPSGQIQWENTIGGNNNEMLYDIELTVDGGYIIGGWSDSGISGDKTSVAFGGYDYWVLKLNQWGAIQWQNSFGGNLNDKLNEIEVDFDGGFLLGGESESGISGNKLDSSRGGLDYWIVKIDSTGNEVEQHTIGGNDSDRIFMIDKVSPSTYFVGGVSRSDSTGEKIEMSIGYYDYWVLEICKNSHSTTNVSICDQYISPSGNYVWTTSGTYNDTIFSATNCDSVITTNLFIANPIIYITSQGATTFCQGDSVILSASPNMSIYQWYRFNIPIPGAVFQNYSAKTRGRYFCIAQNAAGCIDTSNMINVNVPCIPAHTPQLRAFSNQVESTDKVEIFPNPGNGKYNIYAPEGLIDVYNSIGELILSKKVLTENSVIDLSDQPSGIYFLNYHSLNDLILEKIVLIKE